MERDEYDDFDEKYLVPKKVEIIADIQCPWPDGHPKIPEDGGECWVCFSQWRASLPWHQSVQASLFPLNNALFTLLKNLPKEYAKKKRRTQIVKDCWKEFGNEWLGYSCELFGVEIDHRDDPNTFPEWRMIVKSEPNLVIAALRMRVCYEPQIVWKPLYLEMLYLGKARYFISIVNLHQDEDITEDDMRPLLRARRFLLSKGPFPLPRISPPLRKKFNKFLDAAGKLGETGLSFSIINLHKIADYGSRTSFYDFKKAVIKEAGEGEWEQIFKEIEDRFNQLREISSQQKTKKQILTQ